MKIKFKTAIDRIRNSCCPICGQSNVDYGDSQMGNPAYQEASCQDCEARWQEFYILNDVEVDQFGRVINEIEDEGIGLIEKIPDIIETLLSQKKMLPAFIGIDGALDKLIAEKLKES